MNNDQVVILGAGLAGYSLAKELRQLDKNRAITLITADNGDYYSKPQLSTALAVKRTATDLLMNTAKQMEEKLNIQVIPHTTIQYIDRAAKKVIAPHYECHYGQLVLALGADTLSAPLDGDSVEIVCAVNTLEDYKYFRKWLEGKKRIGILGSGLVGCELANDLIEGGYEVQVITPDHYPLQRFVPEVIGGALRDALIARGVTWHFCRFATEVNKGSSSYELLLDTMEKVAVDGVLSAVGLHPRTQLAQSADLMVERGIVTNALLQTSDPNIYALGDCAEVCGQVLQHIAPLLICARALAKTLTGQLTAVSYPAMPIILKTPACPIQVCVAPHRVKGEWRAVGVAPDIEAQFIDSTDCMLGFALSGAALQRRAELIKKLPDLL